MLHLCFCMYVPRGCPAATDQPGPKPKGDMEYICVVNFIFHPWGIKSNTNPIPHLAPIVRIKWNIWRCFEKYKALWKYKALLYWHWGRTFFWSLLLFPSSLKSYYSNLFSPSDFNLSLKMYTGLTANSYEKQTQSIGSFISSFWCSIYRSFAYCSRENGNNRTHYTQFDWFDCAISTACAWVSPGFLL